MAAVSEKAGGVDRESRHRERIFAILDGPGGINRTGSELARMVGCHEGTARRALAAWKAERDRPDSVPVRDVDLDLLRFDPAITPREGVDPATVARYGELIGSGYDGFPPLVAFLDAQGVYWVADGFHRGDAYKAEHVGRVKVEVREGTRDDAIVWAARANALHGQPLGAGAVKRAIRNLLQVPAWQTAGSKAIAAHIVCQRRYVDEVRKELKQAGEVADPDVRTVTRNGTTYTQKKPSGKSTKQQVEERVAEEEAAEPEANGHADPVAPQAPPRAPTAAELDEAFLAKVPVLKRLQGDQLEACKRDALLYRRAMDARQELGKVLQAFGPPKKGHRGIFRMRTESALKLEHPKHWKPCVGCKGSGKADSGRCGDCGGAGYAVPYARDRG